jgi:threonine aldolase
VERVARDAGLRMHMDGARLWNACAASGVTEREYAKHFDSVSVCFSKGLGAPVGSALAGSSQFIRRCRRFAKQFGGGMRQAGIIAAGALYALEHHRDRLGDDHANARCLAERLDAMDGVEVDLATVQTNMVYFDVTVMSAAQLCTRLNDRQVGMLPLGPNRVRAVTHMDVTRDQIDRAVEILTDVLATETTQDA